MIEVVYEEAIYFRPDNSVENEKLIERISKLRGVSYTEKGWKCEDENIFEIRAALKGVKITPHESFNEWVAKNKLTEAVVINSGIIESKISGKNIPEEDIEKACRYFLKAAVNSQKYKKGYWDGYIRLYNKKTKKFPSGLLYLVEEILNRKGIKYKVIYNYQRKPDPQFNWEANNKVTPDPDQIEAIRLADKNLRGVLKAPTGISMPSSLVID